MISGAARPVMVGKNGFGATEALVRPRNVPAAGLWSKERILTFLRKA